MSFFKLRLTRGKLPVWCAVLLAILLLISAGIGYRALASLTVNTVISLPVPLDAFPMVVGDWIGIVMEIPTTTREYMERNFADDYISRRYIDNMTQNWADLYVVYCASRPGGMLGHQPQVCYPANGWIHDSTEKSHFLIGQGREIPCLIHRFHKPAPMYDQTVILNFFITDGHIAVDQRGFSGISGRRFNITRSPARYAAQVQISSTSEASIREAARDMAGLVLDYLPDEEGQVKVFERNGTVKKDLE